MSDPTHGVIANGHHRPEVDMVRWTTTTVVDLLPVDGVLEAIVSGRPAAALP